MRKGAFRPKLWPRIQRAVLDRIMPGLCHRWGLAYGDPHTNALDGREMREALNWAGYLVVKYPTIWPELHEAMWLAARHAQQGSWREFQRHGELMLEDRREGKPRDPEAPNPALLTTIERDPVAPDPTLLPRRRILRHRKA